MMLRCAALEDARGRFGERLVASNRWIATGGQIKRDEGERMVFINQSSDSPKAACIADLIVPLKGCKAVLCRWLA